jgi:predicted ATPase/DNA-binding SARP family transcriptional activator
MGVGRLHVGVLGPFEVRIGGGPAGPAGAKRRGLLAMLALDANSVVPVNRLIDQLWGEEPPASAVNIVQTYVSAWRKVLGRDPLVTVGAGYRLELNAAQSDLLSYRELVGQARVAEAQARHAEAAQLLGDALRLWRGPALVDLSGEAFHDRLVGSLEAGRLEATEAWARTVLHSGGDSGEVAAALVKVQAREPLRETTTELLMWARSAAGQQAEALEAFLATRRLLRDELGADPGPALAAMHERVLRADPTLMTRTSVLASPATPDRTLAGTGLDSFVGRDRDMRQVTALLASHRLVTLTGPGGAGKSRLAAEVLQQQSQGGRPGWFVEMALLRESAQAPATIAAAIGLQVSAGTDPMRTLSEYLADSSALLVLDNLEHLADIHLVVDGLRRSTRDLQILLTSREPLRLSGEQQYPVPLLAVPPADHLTSAPHLERVDSVRLLVDRVRTHLPGFAVTVENADAVAAITRRLDGLPLAVEIVAPWLRLLTPADLASRLSEPLDMPGRRADAPARHRTLRDTIAWSYDMLPAQEQALLCRLAVFAGGFTVTAVEGVCGVAPTVTGETVAESLFNLVDRNLVQVGAPSLGESRFRLLQTVRDFAVDRAGQVLGPEQALLQEKHAGWYALWAARLAANSEGPESDAWLAAAVAEADNLRSAIDRFASGDRPEQFIQLVVDAMTLWFEAGHEAEGESRLADALAAAGPGAPARAIGLTYWAWLRATLNRPEAAAAAAEAVALARRDGDAPVEAFALQTLGDTLDDTAAAEEASRAVFGAADRSETVTIRYGPTAPDAVRCGASYNLAAVWLYRSVPTALSWQQEALRRAELEGDRRITAVNAARLAVVHLLAGNSGSARVQLDKSRELVSQRVTARWEDIVTFAAGQLAHHDGQLDEAEQHLGHVFRSASAAGRPLHTVLGAAALADLYTASGRTDSAHHILDLAERMAGGPADRALLARLHVRRARLDRLDGQDSGAMERLIAVAPALPADALPPERVIWLLESAEHAVHRNDPTSAMGHLNALAGAVAATGVQLPPWEQHRNDALAVLLR